MSRAAKAMRRTAKDDGPEPVDIHVGQRLRLARKLAGLSQGNLGDGIGVSFQAVQKYERGENRLSASKLYAAARIVNQSVSYFFDDIKDAPKAKAGYSFSDDEIQLIQSFRRVPDEVLRRQLVEMAKIIGNDRPVARRKRRSHGEPKL